MAGPRLLAYRSWRVSGMADPIRAAVEELRRRIDENVAQLKSHPALAEIGRLKESLNSLETLLGEPKTSLGTLLTFGIGSEGDEPELARFIRFDEFVGIGALDASKRYLRKRKDARPFDEIVLAIRAGGG